MESKQNSALVAKKPSTITEYFTEVIYGGIDGIVTTFAVVSGFTGAALATDTTIQLTFVVVLLFGLANLFADAASMGLGNYLSVSSEKDLYMAARAKEEAAIKESTAHEVEETVRIMVDRGFSEADARQMVAIYQKNHEYWVDFMMNHKLEMSDPRGTNPIYTGLATFVSFMIFGAVPLLPFIFIPDGTNEQAFFYSSVGTFLALVLLGLLKWKIVGGRLRAALTEVILVGGVAAVIAYGVGVFFGGKI